MPALFDALRLLAGLWFSGRTRRSWRILNLNPVQNSFGSFFWLYVVLILACPVDAGDSGILRPAPALGAARNALAVVQRLPDRQPVSLIIVIFFLRLELARAVAVLFGVISFCTDPVEGGIGAGRLAEQICAVPMVQRRFILVGQRSARNNPHARQKPFPRTRKMAWRCWRSWTSTCSSWKNFQLYLLHEHSRQRRHPRMPGIIISRKWKAAIKTCEVEGVEVWLIADFFKTQISHTSFDDFHS